MACGGCHERTATRNTGGHLRGKQFLLIQRSHPRGGAKAWWTRAPGLLSFSIFPLYPSIPSTPPPCPFTRNDLSLFLFLSSRRKIFSLLPPLLPPSVSRLSREKNTRLEERGPRHTTRRHTPAVNIYPRLKSNEPPHLLAYLPVARVKFVPVIKG